MEERARLVAALDAARAGGARAAEVLRVDRSVLEQVSSRGRAVAREEREFTVRVYLEGGRAGLARHADASPAVQAALAAAAAAPLDPHAGPAERMAVREGGLGIDDRRHAGIEEGDRAEVLQLAERAFSQGGLRVRGLRYRQSRDRRSWMSSRGVEAEEWATTYELGAEVVAGDVEVTHRIASRHFSDVASLPFGPEVRRRLEAVGKRAAMPSDALPVVLEPRVVADLVRGLAPAFAANARRADVFAGTWGGRRLASPALHITDDAGLFGGLLSRAFDDRGVPPIAVTLLKEGVVHSLYHDPETARAEGLRPTGHTWGGRLAPSNLVVRPGSRTRNVILTELADYLLLDRLPAVDAVNGRVKGEVLVGVFRGGERQGTARLVIDVPLPTLLGAVRELAADQERVCEVDTPTLVLDPVLRA